MGMKAYSLFSQKLDKDLDPGGLKFVVPPKSAAFDVSVSFDDKVFKQVTSDSILLTDMNKAAQKACDQTIGAVVSKLKAWDKLIEGMVDKGEKESVIKKQIDGLNKAMAQDVAVGIKGAEAAITAVWDKYSKTKKEYKGYKIKIGLKITGLIAGLATSIALMAATPFTGGASAAIGIIGMAKTGVTLAKEIGTAAMEVESSMKLLAASVRVVESAARKGKAAVHGNEVSAAVLNQFLGVAQPSIKECGSQLQTVQSKMKGIEVKSHNLSKALNRLLDKQEELRKGFMGDVNKQLGKHPSSNAGAHAKTIEKRLDDILGKNYEAVQKSIDATMEMHRRFENGSKVIERDLRPRVVELLKMRANAGYKILDLALELSEIPLALLDGNGIAKSADAIATGLGPTIAAMAYDKLSDKVLDKTLLKQ